MPINYTAAEYRSAVDDAKEAADNTKRDAAKKTVIAAINNLDEYVELADDSKMIDKVNEVLKDRGFHLVRISDADSAGNCNYKITTPSV